jgi:hypothetical protein
MKNFLKLFVVMLGVTTIIFVTYSRDRDQRTIVKNGEEIIVPRSFNLEKEEIKTLEKEGEVIKKIYKKAIKNFFPVKIGEYGAKKIIFLSEENEIKNISTKYIKTAEEKSNFYTFLFIILPILIMILMGWFNKLADHPKLFLVLYYISILIGVIIALNGSMLYTVLWFWIICTGLSLFACGPLGVIFSMFIILPVMVRLNLLSQNYFLLKEVENMSYGMWEYLFIFFAVGCVLFSLREILSPAKEEIEEI